MTNWEAIESFKNCNEAARLQLKAHRAIMDASEIKELKRDIERNELAIKALEREPLWVGEKARKPKYEEPVLVVNDDGLYAIAIWHEDKCGNWSDEWKIMYSPYDSDMWLDNEHGTIKAWCELPNIPTFAPFSVEKEPCEDAISREELLEHFDELVYSWENRHLAEALREWIKHFPSVQPQAVDWDGMIGENNKQSLGKWYVGRIDGKSEDVIPTEKVIEIINKYRNGGQDG